MTLAIPVAAAADPVRAADFRSYNQSIRTPLPDVVAALRDLVGARLVAYLGSVQETRAVRLWVEGERNPSSEVEQRLRLAYRIADLITTREGAGVAATWLQGMCPQLADQVPARLIREAPLEDIQHEVLDAARTFVA